MAVSMSASVGYFKDGNALTEQMRAYEKSLTGLPMTSAENFDCMYFMGYIIGSFDALEASSSQNDKNYTLPDSLASGQVFAIFTKYMNNHPEFWNFRAGILVRLALMEAFPKRW
jgi:hypothetical protein